MRRFLAKGIPPLLENAREPQVHFAVNLRDVESVVMSKSESHESHFQRRLVAVLAGAGLFLLLAGLKPEAVPVHFQDLNMVSHRTLKMWVALICFQSAYR